nr:MAG TPA: hypothetical protein [Caudoviricetes sp.]
MAEQEKAKRKTHTSTAVKRRYNEKHYKKFQADIKIELYERITAYTEKEHISKSEFLQKAISELDK